jgi:hypothetical protein
MVRVCETERMKFLEICNKVVNALCVEVLVTWKYRY